MKRNTTLACLLIAVCALFLSATNAQVKTPTASTTAQANASRQFFAELTKRCGKRFAGATEFPQNADHALVGKNLVMLVVSCSEREIRIPFHVGDDKSRTWILTLSDEGLLFKHDHRHADGTPDEVTNYGGWATANGTNLQQRFPADAETAKLIPEAKTNVWTMQIDNERKRFMYQLERNDALRYRGYFDLAAPLAE